MMKIAVITGANSGFGYLTTIELLKAGYQVVATMRDVRNQTELINEAQVLGVIHQLDIKQIDVTCINEIETVAKYVQEKYQKIHVLINNAGYCEGGFLQDLEMDEWSEQQNTNVLGTVRMIKLFLPLLDHHEKSHIINISSVSGYVGFPGMSAYCSSKFAIEGLSESLRTELLSKHIFVSLVEPASFKTKIWNRGLEKVTAIREQHDPLQKNVYTYAKQSADGAGDPADIAKLISHICDEKHPKLRYRIGKGARFLSFAKRFLPWRVIEMIMMRKLNENR